MEGESAESLGCKIFVGGLSWQTTEEGLRYYFEKFGELTDVAVMIDKKNGQPRGFGFVTFKENTAADLVIGQEHTIDGRLVDIKRAVPRDKAPTATSRHEFRKIFVGGLSPDVTDKELSDYFSMFGIVKDSVIMIDRKTSRSRGFGFVTFDSDEALNSVLRSEHEVRGKWVEVKRAEPRETRPNDFGFGMGGMGGGGGGGMYDMRGGAGMRRPLGGRDDLYGGGGGGYSQDQYNMPSARNAYPYAGTALRNNYPAAAPQGGYARGGGGYNPGLAQGGGGYGYGGAAAGGPAAGYYGGGAGYGSGYGGMAGGQPGAGGYRNVGGAAYPGYGPAAGDVGGGPGGVDPLMAVGGVLEDGGQGGGYGQVGGVLGMHGQQQPASMAMYGGGGGYGGGYGSAVPAAGGAQPRSGGGAMAAASGRVERSYRPY